MSAPGHPACFTRADILALAAIIAQLQARVEAQARELAEVRAFTLPTEAAQGDHVGCPTCGADWENVTGREPYWIARGVEG